MTRKFVYILLALETVLLFVLNLLKYSFTDVFSSVIAFPFEQIGLILKLLSGSGLLGNAIALTLYLAICFLPVYYLIASKDKRKLHLEDALVGLLSSVLLVSLYLMINTENLELIFIGLGALGVAAGKAILSITIWSILWGYLILRFIRLAFDSNTKKLIVYSSVTLYSLCFFFAWIVFGSNFGDLLNSFFALQAQNTGLQAGLGITYVFLVLGFLLDAIPYILNTVIVFLALDLLTEMYNDAHSEKTEILSKQLSLFCYKSLGIVVVSGISFNLLQLLFAKTLRNTEANLSIPIMSVLFVLTVLFFARLISENRALKHDNDLFI